MCPRRRQYTTALDSFISPVSTLVYGYRVKNRAGGCTLRLLCTQIVNARTSIPLQVQVQS